jgi:hypothetical protein
MPLHHMHYLYGVDIVRYLLIAYGGDREHYACKNNYRLPAAMLCSQAKNLKQNNRFKM